MRYLNIKENEILKDKEGLDLLKETSIMDLKSTKFNKEFSNLVKTIKKNSKGDLDLDKVLLDKKEESYYTLYKNINPRHYVRNALRT